MTEFTAKAYEIMRTAHNAAITHISIRNASNTELIKVPIAQVTVDFVATRQTNTYSKTITGSDVAIPSTITKAVLLDTNGNDLGQDTFTAFNINATVDSCAITIQTQIPQVV